MEERRDEWSRLTKWYGICHLRVDPGADPAAAMVLGEPLLVVWEQRDAFTGEEVPPVAFDWPGRPPGPSRRRTAQPHPTEILDGRVRLQASSTPVFVIAD